MAFLFVCAGLSRVNPLPQAMRRPCRSGFTREEADTGSRYL
ncbi:hypothetical protein RK21_04313 [Pseudomonas plecoglossicida]|nr:hypothetical protein RK21_04313 [Pseudomonas plecoglossicida]